MKHINIMSYLHLWIVQLGGIKCNFQHFLHDYLHIWIGQSDGNVNFSSFVLKNLFCHDPTVAKLVVQIVKF